jgi:chromosome segregation ATPase
MQQQLSSVSQELQSLTGLYATLEETNKNMLQEKETALKETEIALKEKQKADVALEEKSQALARIESQLNTLVEQQTILTSELASSRQAQELSEQKLEAVTLQASSADQELASIRGEYSDLQVKYNKLIKPARTSKGKYVVEVFYSKDGNKDIYKIRDSGQSSSTVVSQKELHQRLAKLKQQHEKNLYIRLIFPEDSKLSYNDAWTFSKEILGKYDYYHTN